MKLIVIGCIVSLLLYLIVLIFSSVNARQENARDYEGKILGLHLFDLSSIPENGGRAGSLELKPGSMFYFALSAVSILALAHLQKNKNQR